MQDLFTGYSHIGIYVKDVEEAITFYKEVLGFEHLFTLLNESDGLRIALLKLNNCLIEVLEPPQGKEKIEEGAKQTVNHVGIVVPDIEKAKKHVESFGFEFEDRGVYDVPTFGRPDMDLEVAFFRGPNGERIELFEEIFSESTPEAERKSFWQ